LPSLIRWGPVVGFGLLLLALSRPAGKGISDPDTLWHILAGDHLRATWQFAGADPLSHFTTKAWVLTQWLPELGLSYAHSVGGLRAVALLTQLGRLAVCVAIYVSCRRESGPLAAAVVTGVSILGTAASLSPRPQLVGFALLAVTTAAWTSTLRDLRARWWLVPLTWIWASSHGTWIVGIMLGAAATLGLLMDRRVDLRGAGRLLTVPLLSVAAALATPLGLRILDTFRTVQAVSPFIQEWRRPELTQPSTMAMIVLMFVVGAIWLLRSDLRTWGGAGMLLVGLAWGFAYARSVAVGAIIVAPLAAQALDRVLGRRRPGWGREPRLLAVLVAVTVAVSALAAWIGPRDPIGVPTGLSGSLGSLPARTVVYNDDSLGGWLMWSFPNLEQTADTRAELYGPERARSYLQVMSTGNDWQTLFDRDHPTAVLVAARSPLARALASDRRWVVAGRDRGFVLLTKRP
jgi:hypothetical protein